MNFEQLLALLRAGGTLNLDQLRFLAEEIRTRAAAMPGQITDATPADEAARVEREHQALLADGERVRGLVAEQERAAPAPAQSPDVQAALAAERQRVSAIRRLGRDFNRPDEFVERHIDLGSDEMAVRSAILDELRVASERNPVFSQVQVIRDEAETRSEGMAAALAFRLARAGGERNTQLPVIAQPWAGRDLAEIAAESIGWRGPLRTARQVDEMFQRAFLSTSDFPSIFTNALNVRLLARYEAAAPTYRRWAAPYTASDFRAHPVIRAGDFPALQKVNETGEIKSGKFGESKEEVKVSAYAVSLNISRVMIINDQLMAIEQMLSSAGIRVADWENAEAYTLLLSASGAGPTLLTDSKAVFHADHTNLGSATAITVAAVGTGRASMMKQTTLDGIKANFTPVTILTGPDKLTEAEQLLTLITPAQIPNAVPASMRRLEPVADANITGNPWYLFADPASAPCFVYALLNGFEGPRLTSEDVFDVQGMKVKLEHDFGVAAIDFRGGYRNPGA